MEYCWEDLRVALESGEPENVNQAIDEIRDLEIDERARQFDEWFDDLTSLYIVSEDGYVRQSVVRTVQRLAPGLAAVVNVHGHQQSTSYDVAQVRRQTNAYRDFLLDAITDEDGRVRQSAIRGLRDVCRTYEALEETEAIEALVVELSDVADAQSGKRRKHVLEARDGAEFFLRSGFDRIAEALRRDDDFEDG